MESFPEEMLKTETRQIRDNYFEIAKCLPEPKILTVTKNWASTYDETDPRIQVLDPTRIVLTSEPRMEMLLYPYRFKDGERISDSDGVSERGKKLFRELEMFVTVQFPNKLSEAKKEGPVHPWHKERVENIRSETTKEVIENPYKRLSDMSIVTICAGLMSK
jgi:hypothetical protein